jgi:hypothetical protein
VSTVILNQTEFARALGVTRQAVSKAIKEGAIFVHDGKIDTKNGGNVVWATNSPQKAKAWEKWLKKKDGSVAPSSSKSKVKEETTALKVEKSVEAASVPVFDEAVSADNLTPAQVSETKQKIELKIAKEKLVKALIENSSARSKLIDRDVVQSVEERMWNGLITGLKNMGNVIVMDLEKKILANSGARNEDFFFVENCLMEVVETVKKQKILDVKKKIGE